MDHTDQTACIYRSDFMLSVFSLAKEAHIIPKVAIPVGISPFSDEICNTTLNYCLLFEVYELA